jgi:tryptophan-rich sensory protein
MSSIESWYKKLKKPSWAPKESTFGKVWGVLYIIILIVNIYILSQFFGGKIGWLVALPFWLNLLFILITLIWAMIVILPIAWLMALAYLPYLIWVGIATALQISITYLNS